MSLRVGVIGVGKLGRFHALKYASLSECQFIGVCDLNSQRSQAVADELGVRVFKQPRDLLAEVDAVSIATISTTHHNIGMQALTRGIHVLMEKPLAASTKEAEDLVLLANKRQLILQVGYLERFNGAIQACQTKIKRPIFIDAVRVSNFSGRGEDIDVVLDLMSHDLDLALMMDSSSIQEIQAIGVSLMTDKIDLANVRLRFASGCVANISASRISTHSERNMRIFQKNCCFSLDFSLPACTMLTVGDLKKDKQTIANSLDVSKQDALEAEIRSFINSVRTKKPPLVGGEDGLRVMKVAARITSIILENSQ